MNIYERILDYKSFLLAPGTIITGISGILLLIAILYQPDYLVFGATPYPATPWIYLASAFIGSLLIWYNALDGIREHDFTADIPVSIAVIAAIGIGQYSAAAIVAVLLLVGGLLEDLVAARADRAVEALAKLLPDKVTLHNNGEERIVSLEEVTVGDRVLIRSGERIPVDGEVIQGSSSVNQAVITGESLPVEKNAGDPVFAGTLNEVGVLEIVTTKIGKETTLGQIQRLIEEAQADKAPIERLLDRYAKIYTPIAIILGVALWAVTGDVMRAITMLIIFCPCVMVLATPTALVAAIGNAAGSGSLVKKGAAIEALAKADTVIFDKTGTLTTGNLSLVRIIPVGNIAPDTLLVTAASAEKFSEHPLGKSIVKAAQRAGGEIHDPDSCEILPGLGIAAQVQGREVLVGRPKLFTDRGKEIPQTIERQVTGLTQTGCSVILVMIEQEIRGLMVFEDVIRENACATVSQLHAVGIRTVIVTGDNEGATAKIAKKLGIDEYHTDMLPAEKVSSVKKFQADKKQVIFLGDGVNDGPALATADIGIAMGGAGTDVAIETADIALLSDDLSNLPGLITLSKRSISTIHQNLAFALGVLALAVCLTVPGILTPVTGALLHELSSIPVIANSARLIGSK